ncbi:MAG: thiamine ABC transporter substrate-binding protein [Gammaproteobacteria bacterium]|nr:thiamine ABC transporter substrate-binding protein [Gammaproteobacteria bacterium]
MRRTPKVRRLGGLAIALTLIVAACSPTGSAPKESSTTTSESTTQPAETTAQPTEIVLLTHDAFAVSDNVLADFTSQTGVKVKLLQSDDAGTMLNQAILTKDNPIADVMFGIDNTFLSRALSEGIFDPYASPGLATVPKALQLDPEHHVTPIDFGDVCLNYDKAAFQGDVPAPTSLLDLTDPAYRDMLVVEDPATSSPGLAFLLATIAEFGEEGDYTWKDFWADLAANGVKVDAGWTEAYYSDFSAASDGTRPLVVSYASSPPAEVIFSETPLTSAPTAVITDGCFRQIEFAGILAGTEHPDAARKLIDFMLSKEFQEDIPLNMFVFPANSQAALPPEFIEFTTLPEHPESLDPALIEQNRERWIEDWTEIIRK